MTQQPTLGQLHASDPTAPVDIMVAGNRLTLFAESPPLFAAMLDDMRAARRRIWLEVYIYADDALGQALAEVLIERAQAGLDVRLMFDALGSYAASNSIFERMSAAGVQVHDFHSPWQPAHELSFLEMMNQRNHRKLVVIDDEIAYFGGMNVVDLRGVKSTEDVAVLDLPQSAGWRDLHVRLVGPRQAEIALIMERLWRRRHHQSNRGRRRPWPVTRMLAAEADSMFFFDSQPRLKYHRPQRIFAPLINRARHDVTLSMAYFIPIGRVRRALVRARRRGVRVRVIIPADSDVPAVGYATRYFYHYLLKRRIRIYERNHQMLHGKAMVVDGLWTVIGSCNLDPRSLRINLEFVAVIRSREFAAAVQRICRHEIQHSKRVTWDDYNRRTLWQRLIDRLAWAFRYWL